jgi:subtilase family serine protease
MSPNPSSCAADNRSTLNASCTKVANFRQSPKLFPDLVAEKPTIENANVTTGQLITLNISVSNQGSAASTATYLRYYLSTNSVISSEDTGLGGTAIDALNVLASSAHSFTLNAPTLAGTYYLGGCVDSVVDESVTTNNCSQPLEITVTGPPLPDLVITSPVLSDQSLNPGDSYSFTLTVLNKGNAHSSSTTLRYFLSSDSLIEPSDTPLVVDTIPELLENETSIKGITLNTPSDKGDFWVGACVDVVSGEIIENNNCSLGIKISIGGFPWDLFYPAISGGANK